MVVISKAIIKNFSSKHADAGCALEDWYAIISTIECKNFNELKNTFNSVDAVGNDRYVFNIKGNNYRLIALIIFKVRTVFILFIGTHAEYDKVDASTINFKK